MGQMEACARCVCCQVSDSVVAGETVAGPLHSSSFIHSLLTIPLCSTLTKVHSSLRLQSDLALDVGAIDVIAFWSFPIVVILQLFALNTHSVDAFIS